jgi:hypothetical protein
MGELSSRQEDCFHSLDDDGVPMDDNGLVPPLNEIALDCRSNIRGTGRDPRKRRAKGPDATNRCRLVDVRRSTDNKLHRRRPPPSSNKIVCSSLSAELRSRSETTGISPWRYSRRGQGSVYPSEVPGSQSDIRRRLWGVMHLELHKDDEIHAAFEERCFKTRTRALISCNQSHQRFSTRPGRIDRILWPFGHRCIVIGIRFPDLWRTVRGLSHHTAEILVLPTTTNRDITLYPRAMAMAMTMLRNAWLQ